MFEQGHYAGRTQPSNTRQGTYATAPNGVLLASINSNDPRSMADMLRRALDKWNSLPEKVRMEAGAVPTTTEIRRPERMFPSTGLVLRVFSRDLPREKTAKDWRAEAWNQDFTWYRQPEMLQMVPASLEKGERTVIPVPLVARLARFNLIDNVRGQEPSYAAEHVKEAVLESEVVSVEGSLVRLRLKGKIRTEQEGTWSIAGYRDMDSPSAQKRGVMLDLLGAATYDSAAKRFRSFEVVAIGNRFGATQYNGRHDDLDRAPIGFLITLAGDSAAERVAPAFFSQYGW